MIESLETTMPLPELPERTEADRLNGMKTREQMRNEFRQTRIQAQRNHAYRLWQYFYEMRRHYRGLDMIARRKRVEDIDLTFRYYNGDMYGQYDFLGRYSDHRMDGDFAYSVPLFTAHVEQSFVQMMKVRTRYTIDADDKGNVPLQQVAKFCEELGNKELRRLMKDNVQNEIYNMLLAGESQRMFYWAADPKNPRKSYKPKYKQETIELPESRSCAGCNTTVKPGLTACPRCEGTEMKISPAGQGVRQVEDGYEEILHGENRMHIPHPFSLQRDMSALRAQDSNFLIERSFIDIHAAQYIYQALIKQSSFPLSVEMQMRFDLERASSQTDAIIGSARLAAPGLSTSGFILGRGTGTGSSVFRKVEQEKLYLEPAEYGQFYCTVEEVLPNGNKIPPETFLGEYFDKGMLQHWVGDSLMDVDHCNRARKFPPPVQYRRIAGTNSGAGMSILRALNDLFNDETNLNIAVKHTVGHPLTVLNGKMVDAIPGAGNLLRINRSGVDDVRKAVAQYPGQAMNNADGLSALVQNMMQFIAGTSTIGNNTGGAPDMRAAGTATGIHAMIEQASDRQSGPVDSRSQCDIESIIILLENIQEFADDDLKAKIARRIGPDKAALFFDRQRCSIRHDMTIEIEGNTDMPRSMALHKANLLAFGDVLRGVLGEAEGNPWVLEYLSVMADSMGFSIDIGKGRNDRREAEYRLNLLNEIEPMTLVENQNLATDYLAHAEAMYQRLVQIVGPLGIQANQDNPEVDMPRIFMQEHVAFMDVYKDGLFAEASKGWSKAKQACVIQMWMDHYRMSLVVQDAEQQLHQKLATMLDPDAAQQADQGFKEKLLEALSIDYDTLKPDTQEWVLTNLLGAPPSQDLMAESRNIQAGGEDASGDITKTKAQVIAQDHKATLDREKAERDAALQKDTQSHAAQTQDQLDAAQHYRETERIRLQAEEEEKARTHEKETRAHEAKESEKDRRADIQKARVQAKKQRSASKK